MMNVKIYDAKIKILNSNLKKKDSKDFLIFKIKKTPKNPILTQLGAGRDPGKT